MEHLLSRLIDHIASNMTEVITVDEDYGQLEALDEDNKDMYPLTYPAVLIEPSHVKWSKLQGGNQKGEATLRVRLIIDCYHDTHAGSGTTQDIIYREEMRHKLHSLLEGYRPMGDGGMERTESTFFTFNHGIKVYQSLYTCTVTECLRKGTTTAHTPPRLALSTERP